MSEGSASDSLGALIVHLANQLLESWVSSVEWGNASKRQVDTSADVALLITESADEFDALRDAFEQEIKPRGIIAQMYVHDFCSIVWEILRLRRGKAAIINAAFRDALVHVLTECLSSPEKLQLDLDDQV